MGPESSKSKNDPFYTWASKKSAFCYTVKSKYFWLATLIQNQQVTELGHLK